MTSTTRRHSAADERNQGPLLAVLQQRLPAQGHALEVASGTGQHAAHFAAALPGWIWQASDADPAALASIADWCAGLPNVPAPLHLDLLQQPPDAPQPPTALPHPPLAALPAASLDLIFCANLLHISPWATCGALMQLARRGLRPTGQLITYGPYVVDDEPLAASNAAFDADLRRRNPAWGLRRLQAVADEALAAGLRLTERIALPANNLCLVFQPA